MNQVKKHNKTQNINKIIGSASPGGSVGEAVIPKRFGSKGLSLKS